MLARLASHAPIALQNASLFQASQAAYDALRGAQSQLLQAQKMEALGRLSGGVAHDFNNLLTVSGGRADMIRRRAGTAPMSRRDAELVATTTARAAALTQQVLAFRRRQISARRALDVNGIVHGLWPMLTRLIGEQVVMTSAPGPEPVVVMGDASQLEQVVLNLCVNARDAMPDGGHGARHRRGHGCRDDRADLRPVLHHQDTRPRHGPRARDRLRRGAPGRRRRERGERGRPRGHVPRAAARRRRRGRSRESPGGRAGAVRGDRDRVARRGRS